MESNTATSGAPPCVSIVVATYNRSNVLALVLRTVLWQTVADWELLVIGDACTDDTEAVMASFADPRIRFINLPKNCGEQSGPNNFGAQQARGKFLAWLNHDDFWLPDHLERALKTLDETGADLVFTLCERITAESPGVIVNVSASGLYDPTLFAPASCWVLRRELFVELGPWRSAREIFNVSSQEWIFRAWRSGKRLHLCPQLTVAAIASEKSIGSYARREIDEHAALFERLRDPDAFRAVELTRQLVAPTAMALKAQPVHALLWELIRRPIRRLWIMLGVHPGSIHFALRTRKKGGHIDKLRKRRGLPAK